VVEVVTLMNLANGAVGERFQEEWNKVLENIADPNTDAEEKRRISIHVTVNPDENRELGDVEIKTELKLPSMKAVRTQVFMTRHHGQNVAVEQNPKQMVLDALQPNGPENVVPMPGGRS
jgi:hypothetical protein